VREPSSSRDGKSNAVRAAIQKVVTTLRGAEWMPITAARVLLGVFFCISGGTKLFVRSQFDEMVQTIVQSHIPLPYANALFVSLVEFACGGGLALGLLTTVCAAMLTGDMLVAIATNRIHSIQASGILSWVDDFLYLPEVLYVLMLLWLVCSGPGRYSLDGFLARRAGIARVER
jgi:putative oxidoreductase